MSKKENKEKPNHPCCCRLIYLAFGCQPFFFFSYRSCGLYEKDWLIRADIFAIIKLSYLCGVFKLATFRVYWSQI